MHEYDLGEIRHWLEKFLPPLLRLQPVQALRYSQRSQGVVSGGALSPRGDWRAPSDAVADVWLAELRENVPAE